MSIFECRTGKVFRQKMRFPANPWQLKLSTKGRLTNLRFSEVIDGLELVQFFLCLITDRLEMIDDGEGCPGFHA